MVGVQVRVCVTQNTYPQAADSSWSPWSLNSSDGTTYEPATEYNHVLIPPLYPEGQAAERRDLPEGLDPVPGAEDLASRDRPVDHRRRGPGPHLGAVTGGAQDQSENTISLILYIVPEKSGQPGRALGRNPLIGLATEGKVNA